jgi:hypothetical protein
MGGLFSRVLLLQVAEPVGVGEDALAGFALGAVEVVERAAAIKVAVGDRGHGHV